MFERISRHGVTPALVHEGEQDVRPVRLLCNPLILIASMRMSTAVRSYAAEGNATLDWLHSLDSDRPTLRSAVLRSDGEDLDSRLAQYLLDLLCSETPSSFRSFQRPLELEFLMPTLAAAGTCSTRRKWYTGSMSSGAQRDRGERQDTDESEERYTARRRWRVFIEALQASPHSSGLDFAAQLEKEALVMDELSLAALPTARRTGPAA